MLNAILSLPNNALSALFSTIGVEHPVTPLDPSRLQKVKFMGKCKTMYDSLDCIDACCYLMKKSQKVTSKNLLSYVSSYLSTTVVISLRAIIFNYMYNHVKIP